jgi:hypothetical protein
MTQWINGAMDQCVESGSTLVPEVSWFKIRSTSDPAPISIVIP